MRNERISATTFRGSNVLVEFGGPRMNPRDAFREREFRVRADIPLNPPSPLLFARTRECVIDSPRDTALLFSLRRRITRQEHRHVAALLDANTRDEHPLTAELTAAFAAAESRVLNGRAKHREKKRDQLRKLLNGPRIRKRIRKFTDLCHVLFLKCRRRLTLRQIALRLRIPQARVAFLWRELRTTRGQRSAHDQARICRSLASLSHLAAFFRAHRLDPGFLQRSLRANYQLLQDGQNTELAISFDLYYKNFRDFGFRYRPIRYAAHIKREIRGRHLQSFLQVYLQLILDEEKFEIVFFDESALCPSNFKKLAWRATGDRSLTRTRIKYEKIMLVGAMNRDGVVGVRFLHSSFVTTAFIDFALEILRHVAERERGRRQIVLFLDNAPTHRSTEFLQFCRQNGVIVLFNLPHSPQLNPIELLWEFVKRPLRSITDYAK